MAKKPTKITRYDLYDALYEAIDKTADQGIELTPATLCGSTGLDSIDILEVFIEVEEQCSITLGTSPDNWQSMTLAELADFMWETQKVLTK